jgi:hypothetical protein
MKLSNLVFSLLHDSLYSFSHVPIKVTNRYFDHPKTLNQQFSAQHFAF